mmetsp:Transcript_6001/g.15840  ORF Transcript_6001/g.15840 Transcript_6001/m.15840 type:complete len:238 (+) Transcript_6001:2-715(+)
MLSERRHAARQTFHLLEHILKHKLNAAPAHQPLARHLHNGLNDALALAEALADNVSLPLVQLLVQQAEVSQFHCGLQRRQFPQHVPHLAGGLPLRVQLCLRLAPGVVELRLHPGVLFLDSSIALGAELRHLDLHVCLLLGRPVLPLGLALRHLLRGDRLLLQEPLLGDFFLLDFALALHLHLLNFSLERRLFVGRGHEHLYDLLMGLLQVGHVLHQGTDQRCDDILCLARSRRRERL